MFPLALDGKKSYLAAAGLMGLALFQFASGEMGTALQTFFSGLGVLGLRHAMEKAAGGADPATPAGGH